MLLQGLLREDKSPRQTNPALFPTAMIPRGLRRYLFTKAEASIDKYAIAILRGTSPLAWQQAKLFGTFELSDAASKVDLDALAARYPDPGYWSKALKEAMEVPLG